MSTPVTRRVTRYIGIVLPVVVRGETRRTADDGCRAEWLVSRCAADRRRRGTGGRGQVWL